VPKRKLRQALMYGAHDALVTWHLCFDKDVAKRNLFFTPPCPRPDRIGPLAYAHWVWLPIADLASKYDVVTGEGFPHRGFLPHHLYKG
jgi:hypothetical protein